MLLEGDFANNGPAKNEKNNGQLVNRRQGFSCRREKAVVNSNS
jgi:hypothetical protein